MSGKGRNTITVFVFLILTLVLFTGCPADIENFTDEYDVESGAWAGTWVATFQAPNGALYILTFNLRQQGRDLYGTLHQSLTYQGCEAKTNSRVAGRADKDDEWANLEQWEGTTTKACPSHRIELDNGPACTAKMGLAKDTFSCQNRIFHKQ